MARGAGTWISDCSSTAHKCSRPSRRQKASAVATVSLRPGLITRPRAISRSPSRGRDEVDLVLGGQHVAARRHQAVGGVAAGAVQHRADQGAVEEALLLGQARIGRRLEHAARRGRPRPARCRAPASGPAARSSPAPRRRNPGSAARTSLIGGHLCAARGVDKGARFGQRITAARRPCQRAQEREAMVQCGECRARTWWCSIWAGC